VVYDGPVATHREQTTKELDQVKITLKQWIEFVGSVITTGLAVAAAMSFMIMALSFIYRT
jgi:hypothetical protein